MENKTVGGFGRKKRKYGKLSLDQKIQIIRAAEMGYSQRTLASQYNCGKTQVHLLVTQKDLWLAKWERTRKGESWSRSRGIPTVSEINSLVWDFYKKACSNDINVSVSMLLQRAKQVAHALHVHNFNADLTWFEKFKKEFNVVLPLSDDGNGTPSNTVHSDEIFDPLLNNYEKCNVYYLGVAELYHRTLPSVGFKNQEHITLCFCVSASGDKEVISLVFEENACVESELWNVTVPCFSSPMGQVTPEVYQHSLDVLNQKMRQLDKKICLYVDYAHFPDDLAKAMSNIEISQWPWPFNVQEVVNNFRLLYCQRLMTSLAASCSDEKWINVQEEVKLLPMSKIMRIMLSSWKKVSSKVIESSFNFGQSTNNQDLQCQDINKNLLDEIQQLVLLFRNADNNANNSHPNDVSSIAEEIFYPLQPDTTGEENSQDNDNVKKDRPNQESEAARPLPKAEVFPTILKLEMLILSMPDCPKRQNALDTLDTLEQSLQELIIAEKTQSRPDTPEKTLPDISSSP